MNLTPRWVEFLTKAGHEAYHWSTLGALNATDATVMQVARERDAIVLTHDLDFGAILAASGGTKPSVIQIRAEALGPEDIGQSVLTALRLLEVELNTGALLTIEPARTRVRFLPLRGS